MNCFLRTNSQEIRDRLQKSGITVCDCAAFPDSEWLWCHHSNVVHGVFPPEEGSFEERIFGNKDTFKDKFLTIYPEYTDCSDNVELFIKLIQA